MRAACNDALRYAISLLLRCGGALEEIRHRRRIRTFRSGQARLRARFAIGAETPLALEVPPVDPALASRGAQVALTSGTSGEPKRVLYTAPRLRAVRAVFVASFLRCFWNLGIRRTSLYVFGSLEREASLSALLLAEEKLPAYLATLQAPYRIQAHPALQGLKDAYGAAAVRLWILAVSNPGVLYSTNPSTLSTFFDEVETDWMRCSALARRCVRQPGDLDPQALRLVRRLASRGWIERLERIAASAQALPVTDWAPAIRTYACWTGGYVAPFLERLERRLPPPRFRRVPMYSMSTETIETIPDFRAGRVAFLPLAPETLFEFLETAGPEEPGSLLAADELRPGSVYEMVVSHPFGLKRYRTGDLFRVEGFVAGLPDLRFLRRRGLGYSFTGEKLTGGQIGEALRELRAEYGEFAAGQAFTCFPSQPIGSKVPCYRLAAIRIEGSAREAPANLGGRFDELLAARNPEYESKRRSGRLGAIAFQQLELHEFRRLTSQLNLGDWDAQFKFLPLYPRLWESLAAD